MPTIVIIEDKVERLDLLVIGSSHDIPYRELVKDFPDLISTYLEVDDFSIPVVFVSLNPKMTLIYGELSSKKGSLKPDSLSELNLAVLNLLLEMKKPDQKILMASYFEFPKALNLSDYRLRLPADNKYIMRKFAEMK